MKSKKRCILTVFIFFSIIVPQLAAAETIVNETRHVLANMTTGWIYDNTYVKTIYISLEVLNGEDIGFYVFDLDNYYNWKDGLPYETIIEKREITLLEDAFSADNGVTYYIILDNTEKSYSVDVEIIVQDSAIKSVTEEEKPTIFIIIILGIIFTVGIAALTAIMLRNRRRSKEEVLTSSTIRTKSPQREQTSKTKGWFCPNCKNKVVDIEEYCSYCGYRIYRNK